MRDRINSAARRLPTWPVYIVGLIPMGAFFYMGLTGALGPEPIKALEHEYGELALKLLIAGLFITPLRRLAGLNLFKFRRALGLLAFAYVAAHLLVWLVLDMGDVARIWADLLKRPYITVGMAGFVLLVPLAVTSNQRAIRAMGAGWRKLHRLVYPAVLLGGVHYLLLVKGWQVEPLIYMAVILGLLVLRLPQTTRLIPSRG